MTVIGQTHRRYAAYKEEATFGVPDGPTGAKIIRRTNVGINLQKQAYESGEKRRDFQRSDLRHGSRMVSGPIDGELSAGTWEDFIAATLRKNFVTIAQIVADTGDGFSITSNVLTRAGGGGGSFIDDGLRAGMIIRLGAMSVTGNLARNILVTAVTATTATLKAMDGAAIANDSTPDTNATVDVVGQVSYIPLTGHTTKSFTIEDVKEDLDFSEGYSGCRFMGMNVAVQPNAMATIGFTVMGQDQDLYTGGASPYYTSPTAAGQDTVLAGSTGLILINGVEVGVVTGFSLSVDLQGEVPPVVGSDIAPNVLYGKAAVVKGQMTMFVKDQVFLGYFRDETEFDVVLFLSEPTSEPRDFVSFYLPRVKLSNTNFDDPDTAMQQTCDFEALLNIPATGEIDTTIMVQDSTLS